MCLSVFAVILAISTVLRSSDLEDGDDGSIYSQRMGISSLHIYKFGVVNEWKGWEPFRDYALKEGIPISEDFIITPIAASEKDFPDAFLKKLQDFREALKVAHRYSDFQGNIEEEKMVTPFV